MDKSENRFHLLLLISVFVVATCGLIYELIAGTVASYLLGDSVTQFSTIIGTYLFSMGIGSWLSRFFKSNLLSWFIRIELLVGLTGGFSSSLLFLLFNQVESFRLVLYALVGLTGVFVGLEIPLLMRILKDRYEFSDLVSRVFTFDYIGALLASLIFPLVLIPYLGLLKTSFLFGILNVLVAWLLFEKFKSDVQGKRIMQWMLIFSTAALLGGFVFSERIMRTSESLAYADKVIYAGSSPYQRLVLTRNNSDIKLFLNGNLQFSSADEYRYHEALVHPACTYSKQLNRVLVLGGGDGLAVRELLRYPEIKSIQLVDLDPMMTKLFSSNPLLLELNKQALKHPKVTINNTDAFTWLRTCSIQFDLILIDFPDPSNYSIGKLYSTTFYKELKRCLSKDGLAVIQSTSPFVAPKSFWCINQTLNEVGLATQPFHIYVPSFGEWGYVLAGHTIGSSPVRPIPTGLRFYTPESFAQMCWFPTDMMERQTDVNRLNNQVLVHYFEKEWSVYN
ncbi:MAG: polyamine aminopropyltransferase [Bacteroidia bacterium]|nr:polyamine aminopropyltransferase [Bacteroidia bacterium]